MQFTKMHGIGNDFVMVSGLGEGGPERAAEAKARAAELCDRKFGVGGDGVIVINPGQNAPFAMTMYNPDGSESEMCGNGIRCFAKYVYDRGFTAGQTDLPIETGAGLLSVQAQFGEDGLVSAVRVDMGEPVLKPELIPTKLAAGLEQVLNAPIMAGDRTLRVTCVSMGNPHAVTFVNHVENYPVAEIGPLVEHHQAFPNRINTEFIEVVSESETRFRVWERAAGETLACGTGACASVVAGALTGRTGRRVLVHLPGGDLDIEWSEADNHVYMTGPAATVFEGEI